MDGLIAFFGREKLEGGRAGAKHGAFFIIALVPGVNDGPAKNFFVKFSDLIKVFGVELEAKLTYFGQGVELETRHEPKKFSCLSLNRFLRETRELMTFYITIALPLGSTFIPYGASTALYPPDTFPV